MSRFSKKKKEHIGLSPYALVFRGQKKTEQVKLRLIEFNLDTVSEKNISKSKDLEEISKDSKIHWLNIDGLDNVHWMEAVSDSFYIDNSILSDVMNPGVRPKVHEFDRGLFIALKMLQYNEKSERLTAENLSLIICKNTLLSFQEQTGTVFEPIRERILKHKSKIRTSGADYLAFALLDVVVDNYIFITGLLGEKIENLEEAMISDPPKEVLESINFYKRELNFLRKCINPAREMIQNLAKMDSDIIQNDNKQHFKELLDNINEAADLSDSYREMLYDQLNMYHSSMSTKLNDIMRILTVYSVVFIPLTFLVGVYGTNFKYIPETDWKYGYFAMWALMFIVAAILIWFFRRKKFL